MTVGSWFAWGVRMTVNWTWHIARNARKFTVKIAFPHLIATAGIVITMGFAPAANQHLIVKNVEVGFVQIVILWRNVMNVGVEFVTAATTTTMLGFVHVPTVIGLYATNAARCNIVEMKIAVQLFAMIANLKIGNVRGVATSMIITTIMIRQK